MFSSCNKGNLDIVDTYNYKLGKVSNMNEIDEIMNKINEKWINMKEYIDYSIDGNIITINCKYNYYVWYTYVNSNGIPLGYLRDANKAIDTFIRLRRSMSIDQFATYFKDDELNEFRFFCDTGRLIRPLLVIENLKKIPDIVNSKTHGSSILPLLLSSGCLEYVSTTEEKNIKSTFSFQDVFSDLYTHLEVSDVSFVGILAALSPFFRHNQGPRLVYWIGMSKQAICCSTNNDMGACNNTFFKIWSKTCRINSIFSYAKYGSNT